MCEDLDTFTRNLLCVCVYILRTIIIFISLQFTQTNMDVTYTVNSRYSGPLNCGHLDTAATYLGTDLKLHQVCTNLVSDLRSPRYSILQPLLETPISAVVFILQPEVMFVGVVMIKT